MNIIRRFWQRAGIYLLSFLVPFVVILLAYWETGVYPFGNYSFLKRDAFDQYAPFLMEFYRKLKNHESLLYSWNTGMGGGFLPVYAYYLSSPVNWLVILLPQKYVIDAIDMLILVKTSLCGVAFSWYLVERFKQKNSYTVAIASCYALSSYMMQYCNNVIWLDCLMLFPLIVAGLERLYREGKGRLYYVTLSLAIISNYYISIIICLFLILYYSFLVFTASKNENENMDMNGSRKRKTILKKKEMWSDFRKFMVHSVLAGATGAVVILPSALALSGTQSGNFKFPTQLHFYNHLSDVAMRHLMLVGEINDHSANLYCSVVVLLLLPLYLLNPKINLREKIGKMIFGAFMLLSFNLNILDYIWHGFHFTNDLPARNSFVYIFLVLIMSYEALLRLHELTDRRLLTGIMISVGFLMGLWQLKIGKERAEVYYPEKIIYLTLIFVTVYIALILWIKKGKKCIGIGQVIFVVIIGYELYMNSTTGIYSTHTRSSILSDNKIMQYTVKMLQREDKSFYRVEKAENRTSNDGAWDGYYACTGFSSTANEGVREFYRMFGLEQTINYYTGYGRTPVSEALFSIKYLISKEKIEEEGWQLFDEIVEYKDGSIISRFHDKGGRDEETASNREIMKEEKEIKERVYLYQNQYVLPLAFLVEADFESLIDEKLTDPFQVMNRFYFGVTGDEDKMFDEIDVNNTDNQSEFVMPQTGTAYFKYTTSPMIYKITVTTPEGEETMDVGKFLTRSYIVGLGNLSKDTKVQTEIIDEGVKEDIPAKVNACRYHQGSIKKLLDQLDTTPLVIDRRTNEIIEGHIESEHDGMLYTSIPYEKGWSASVDGKSVKVHPLKGAFVSIPLTKGEHKIRLQYHAHGLWPGIVITLSAFLLYCLMERRKKVVNNS